MTGDAHGFERHLTVELRAQELNRIAGGPFSELDVTWMLPVLYERRMFMIAVTPEAFASWKLLPTRNGIHEIAASGASSPGRVRT